MIQETISIVIFVSTYILIIWGKFDRATTSMVGASLMLFSNIISQQNAISKIDFNTLGLLIGMMIIVMITMKSGVFEYIAIKIVKITKADPIKILIYISLLTGLLSALLDNVTTIFLILPLTLSISKDLELDPIPLIMSQIFASNVGGTATLIGDPPNILIGSAVNLSFTDFLLNNGVIVIPMLLLVTYIFAIVYKRKLKTSDILKNKIMCIDERMCIKDVGLLIKGLAILFLVIIGFLFHEQIHYDSATIAIGGAFILLLISGMKFNSIMHEVEWKTIFFFTGLFILVGGLEETGIINTMAKQVLDLTNGNLILTTLCILWVSAVASAFIDNIPFVTAMIPLIRDLGQMSSMNLMPLWWALSLGACLGGNGTIVGASANVIAVGLAEDKGHSISFGKFFRIAFPMMILTIVISTVYMYLRYLLLS